MADCMCSVERDGAAKQEQDQQLLGAVEKVKGEGRGNAQVVERHSLATTWVLYSISGKPRNLDSVSSLSLQ